MDTGLLHTLLVGLEDESLSGPLMLSDVVNASVRNWMKADPGRKIRPFQFVALAAAMRTQQALSPVVPRDDVLRHETLVREDDNFATEAKTAETLGLIVEDLRQRFLVPLNGTSEPINIIICRTKQRDRTGKVVGCCTEEEIAKGCDAGAGTEYFAKTNGRDIVFAGMLRNSDSRRKEFRFVGQSLQSVTLFTAYHEFGHVFYLNPAGRASFATAYVFYSAAAAVLDPKLREEAGVLVGDMDFNEFQASIFALSSLVRRSGD